MPRSENNRRFSSIDTLDYKSGLEFLRAHSPADLARDSLIGIEKESLRVSPEGQIAQTPHPAGLLGSALTHSRITTDYAEPQLELITRPHHSIKRVLKELDELHRWVYQHLRGELLWSSSMPCVIQGEESIPIAQYGSSHPGQMKTVYRRGLGYRYGKTMQAISGIHFNYSLPEAFWRALMDYSGAQEDPAAFRSEHYMAMLRSLQRHGWLIPYLFGASPAICESFLNHQPTTLEYLGRKTYYEPFATSLRLGDIGYQNRQEGNTGVRIRYDNLKTYIGSLENATETPCPEYRKIGVVVDGVYRQLNDHQLQIENEYYSSVRPKTVVRGLEKPVRAMEERGIDYVELRSVDVNAFHPLGVSESQLYFLEAFMIHALLTASPPISLEEHDRIDNNLNLAAHWGRDPDLVLRKRGERITLRDWADELMNELEPICQWLDRDLPDAPYHAAWREQRWKIDHPDLIPSTRIVEALKQGKESFAEFATRLSRQTADYFRRRPLPAASAADFKAEADQSLRRQRELEARQEESFGEFLERYFAQ